MTIKSRRKKINMAYENQYTFEVMVRGYHVYHEIWAAAVGEELSWVWLSWLWRGTWYAS